MTSLKINRDADGIVTLTLDVNAQKPRGGVVVLDQWLVSAIDQAMISIESGQKPTGFILMSASSRVFVAGADLAEIESLDDAELAAYLQAGIAAFGRIARLPCPSVAIVHKAALGGGLELALHCDAVIGTLPAEGEKPWRVGLPEASLGLCPGWGGSQTLPARIDPATAIKAAAAGETWPCTAIPAGLMDATLPAGGDLRAAAIAWIKAHPKSAPMKAPRSIGPAAPASPAAPTSPAIRAALDACRPSLPATPAAAAVAECIAIGLQEGFSAGIDAERAHLVRLRHTPEAKEKLAAFLRK